MYNYYQQQPTNSYNKLPTYAQTPLMLKGHPVSSLEEVKATSIDFDGSIFYFPDIANKRIYTKQVDMNGIASLNMYELKPIPQEPSISQNDFVTRQEFEQTIATLINQLPKAEQKVEDKSLQKAKPSYKEAF